MSHNTLNLNYNRPRILRISPGQNSMSLDSLFSKCPFHPSLFLYTKGSHSKYWDCTWDSLGACMTPIHQVQVHQLRFDLNISIKTSMCYFISQINQLVITVMFEFFCWTIYLTYLEGTDISQHFVSFEFHLNVVQC